MKFPRRTFLHLAAGAAALPALSRTVRAQAYPSRPVRLVVGFAAGGPTDITARLIGQYLSDRLGQPFIVENRPGASSNIATEVVVNAPPDGNTLLLVTVSITINATLYQKPSFNLVNDVAPVAGIIRYPNVMEVNPSLPARTVPEFIAYAKANPDKINVSTPGSGTTQHLSAEMFKMMAGVDMLMVHYRGSAPALTDLIGGQVQAMFDAIPSSIGHIKSNELRALAVTTAARSGALPDVPSLADFVPGFEASGWNGIAAPKDTPTEIVNKLNMAINAALADANFKARLADLGGIALPGSPADFAKLFADDTEKWAKVIKFANIKPE